MYLSAVSLIATTMFNQVLRDDKLSSQDYYTRAYELYKTIDVTPEGWEKLIMMLKKSIELDRTNADAHELLGKVYGEIASVYNDNGDYVSARDYYEKAVVEYFTVLKFDPRSRAKQYLAEVYCNIGRNERAIEVLNEYIKETDDGIARSLIKQLKQKNGSCSP